MLLVVAHHAGLPLPGGFVGVDVFFVISGYVITQLLLAELVATGGLSLITFYARRARRLLPALTVMLVVVAIAAGLLLSPLGAQQQAVDTTVGASSFTANIQLFQTPKGYFDPDTKTNAVLHTWSLSVEEQFYFVFPLGLLLVWRLTTRIAGRRRAAGWLVASIVIISMLSLLVSWLASHGRLSSLAHQFGGGTRELAFYMPFTRIWEFGAGVMVALIAAQLRARWLAVILGATGLVVVVSSAVVITALDPFPGTVALWPVIGTVMLLIAGAQRTPTTQLLSSRPLVFIGDVSYGWYLWHWPLIVFSHALWPGEFWPVLGAALVALPVAWMSYRFVEHPLRAAKGWSNRRGLLLGVGCIVASLLAALGLSMVARREAATAPARFLATALEPHANEVRGCSNGPLLGTLELEPCTWTVEGSVGTVLLVGDSNAGQFTEPVAAAANQAGFNFSVAARFTCPFVDLDVLVPGRDIAACRRFVRDTVEKLVLQRPALVIIASASTAYLNWDAVTFVDRTSGARSSTRDAKLRAWQAGLRAVVTRLAAAGIPTVVVHTIPWLEQLSLVTCPYLRIRSDVRSCGSSASRSEIERQQQATRDAERQAVAGLAGASTVDFTEELCTATECTALRGDRWLYRDSGHLSVAGARSLTPSFTRLLGEHVTR
ncbi:MAG: acyltransferase [Myxococcota bacterium]|nr:acyltransferase [Myxococcota bacterium]